MAKAIQRGEEGKSQNAGRCGKKRRDSKRSVHYFGGGHGAPGFLIPVVSYAPRLLALAYFRNWQSITYSTYRTLTETLEEPIMAGLMYFKSLSRHNKRCTMNVSGNIPKASKKGTSSGVAKESTNNDHVVDNDCV